MKKAYLTYIILLVLAAPATFWTAFEMYGLTMGGAQMLFYSITHAYPILYLIIFLSLPFFILVCLYNIALLVMAALKKKNVISSYDIAIILFFQLFHILALFTYEHWAHSGFRVAACFVGLLFLLIATIDAFKVIATYNNSFNQIGAKGAPLG